MLHMNAMKSYQQAEQEFLVEGASPHRLVQILFDELLVSLDRAEYGMQVTDLAAKSAGTSKALTILYVLAQSLDFDKGGDLAQTLSQVYEWARRSVIQASSDNTVSLLAEVRSTISGISDAWKTIAIAA